jgi:hypothetical protein
MRVIKEFGLSPEVKCTLFSWNGKYLIKLENGTFEQTYKVSELDISGQSEIDSWIQSSDFLEKANAVFRLMDGNLDQLFS